MSRNRKNNNMNNVAPVPTPNNDAVVEISSSTDDHNFDMSETLLYHQLRPLLVCMRVFGLFFARSSRDKRTHLESVAFYCYLINFLMVLNMIRSVSVYRAEDEFGHVLVQRVLFTIWSAECTFKALLMTTFSIRKDGFSHFFREWKQTCGEVRLDRICLIMMRKYIVLAFLFIVANSVVFTLILIYVPVLENIYLDVVWRNARDYGDLLIFKVTLGFLAVLNSSASMFPVSLFVVLCFATGKQLDRFTADMQKGIATNEFHGNIEKYRLRHQNLCSLIQILDHIFAPMLAVIFGANIPMFCLVMYTMISSLDIHISLLLINLFWLCFLLLQMTLVSITSALVNVKAHSPLDHIYGLRFSETSSEIQLQMMLFLNKLTGTQIGITALNLFVIDKPTILTVAGMMLTYFVILIQFKMPISSECVCNITGNVLLGNQTLQLTHE